jgi:hypothetical protein
MVLSEQFELIETRTISGRGILRFPDEDDYRHFYVYVDVVRYPLVDFSNSKWNPDRSEYAKLGWIIDEYIVREDVLNYGRQRFDWAVDPTGYLASYLVCAFGGVIGYLDYLAPFIPAPALVSDPTNPLFAHPLKYLPSRLNIVCRESTAVEVSLFGLKYDVRCPDATPTPKRPPDLPEPTAITPSGSPILVSRPYDEIDDNGNTIPFREDESPPPPPEIPGEACVKYIVTIEYEQRFGDPLTTKQIICYGEIGEPFIAPSGGANAVVLPCRGYAFPGLDEGCQPSIVNRTVFVSDSVRSDATPEIVGFEEYIP